eukprot:CAMPEP_0206493352 /NCGR_PEP_ID=MMETSP0324_2-20121206/46903_1 /ASSEMBLY_ACC=CAM_ASM_000836 /TAXON_ID=2866 /ORGANISM="Crypthecodinium cohnii, Strain Seligo" /LENGTH=603 /DNA_ID=CAMNT_0053976443 /DNA_START=127 /DNA_END=1935 /DNA_ORIENTATION=-
MALPRLKHQPFRGRPPQATRTEPINPGVHFGDLPGFDGALARRRTEVENPGFSISARATIFGNSAQTPRGKLQRQQSNGAGLAITVSGGTSSTANENTQSNAPFHAQGGFGSQARSFGRSNAVAHEVLDEAQVRALVGDQIEDDLKHLLVVVREDLKRLYGEVDHSRTGRLTNQKVKALYRKLGDQWADEAFSFIPKHPDGPEEGAVSQDVFNGVALRMSRRFEVKEEKEVQQLAQTQILLPVMTRMASGDEEHKEGRERSKTLTIGPSGSGQGKEHHIMRGLASARQPHERRGGIIDLDEAWTTGGGGTAALLARAQQVNGQSPSSQDLRAGSKGSAGEGATGSNFNRQRAKTGPVTMGSSTTSKIRPFYSSSGSNNGAGRRTSEGGGDVFTTTSSSSVRASLTGNSAATSAVASGPPAPPPRPDSLASRLSILNSDTAPAPAESKPQRENPHLSISLSNSSEGDEEQDSSGDGSSGSDSEAGSHSASDSDGSGSYGSEEEEDGSGGSYSDEDGSDAKSSFEGSSGSSGSSSIFDVNTERSKPGRSHRRKHKKKGKRASLGGTAGRSTLVVAALEAVAARQSMAETKAMEEAVWAAGTVNLP